MAVSRLSQQSLINAFPKGNTFWDGITATSAMDALGVYEVGIEAPTSINFTSIPQTYTHLQMRVFVKNTVSGSTVDNLTMSLNNVTTGSLYSGHYLRGDGSSTGSSIGYSNLNNFFTAAWAPAASPSSTFGVGIIDILDYAQTSTFKTIMSLSGADNNSSGTVSLSSGTLRSGDAVTSIQLFGATFAQYTSVALYGVR